MVPSTHEPPSLKVAETDIGRGRNPPSLPASFLKINKQTTTTAETKFSTDTFCCSFQLISSLADDDDVGFMSSDVGLTY